MTLPFTPIWKKEDITKFLPTLKEIKFSSIGTKKDVRGNKLYILKHFGAKLHIIAAMTTAVQKELEVTLMEHMFATNKA